MSKRVKNIAKTLHEDFDDNLSEIYKGISDLLLKHTEYFSLLEPKDVIALNYYIYSLNRTGNFELAEKIIPELHLVSFFDYDPNNIHMEDCDQCDGDGRVECDNCDGSGSISCEYCEGDGELECEDCEGDGKISCKICDGSGETEDGECKDCGGDGEIPCGGCGGDGRRTCRYCGGDGGETCGDCSGSGAESCYKCSSEGDIETEEVDYEIREYLFFEKDIIDYCEAEKETKSPISEQVPFFKRPTSLLMNVNKEHAEFDDSLKKGNNYCFSIEPLENVKLFFHTSREKKGKTITSWEEPEDYFA